MSGPIATLPNEVLLEVFKGCLPDDGISILSPTDRPILFIVPKVCRLWRDVMYGFPAFWCHLSTYREIVDKDTMDILGAWLRRSQHLPIQFQLVMRVPHERRMDMRIDENTRYRSNLAPPSRFLVKLLRPVGANITSLSLHNIPTRHVTALPPSAFPSLKRLVFSGARENFNWVDHGDVKAFADTPTLTHVTVQHRYPQGLQYHLKLPYSQLTHFIDYGPVYDTDFDFFTKTLPQMTHLRYLAMHGAYCSVHHPQLTLHALETLALDLWTNQTSTFMEKLNLPRLQTLHIFPGYTVLRSQFAAARLSRLHTLTHLSVAQPAGAASLAELATTFLAVPHLISLETNHSDEIFRALTYDETDPTSRLLLPILETLTIRYFNSLAPNPLPKVKESWDRVIPPFLALRLREGAPCSKLKSIHILANQIDDDTHRIIQRIRVGALVDSLRSGAPTGALLEVTADKLRWPTEMMDSLVRDEEIRGWHGVEELVVRPSQTFRGCL